MKKWLLSCWKLFWAQDWLAILMVAAMLTAGLTFIYSASWRGEETGIVGAWFSKQIVWVAIGSAVALVLLWTDYHIWIRYAWWGYLAAVVLLVLVLLIGVRVYGAYRWLNVFGVLIQPSEFAKVAWVVVMARVLGGGAVTPRTIGFILVGSLLTLIPFVLIVKEPDLGTAMVLLPTALFLLIAAGAAWRYLIGFGLLGAALSPLGWLVLSAYQKERILTFLNPSRDPLDSGWNALQSAIAVGSGGWSGKGFLNGTQNVLGFLPRTVSPSDFIFPVIAEETGFIGSSLLLLAYAILLTCYIRIAWTAGDRQGGLMVVGLAGLLFCHVFINIGMTIGLLPITGLPLPFISSGGSFMLSTLAGFGLVQSVYVRRKRREV